MIAFRPWRPRQAWTALLAGLLLAGLTASNLLWIRRHVLASPPPWDPGLYLFLSQRYYHAWTEGGAMALLREVRSRPESQAPLLPLTAVPMYLAFGDSRLPAYATSSLYACALLGATALLARRRAGDAAALWAIFVGATFSAPLKLARDYQMDLAAAALLAAAIASAERSDGFARRAWSVATGVLAGLTCLAKTMAAPFLAAPILFVFARSWKKGDRPRVVSNLLLAASVAAAVASVWWVPHLGPAVRYLLFYGWGEGAAPYDPTGGAALLSLSNLAYYALAFANEGASVPYLAIALVVLGAEAWRRRGAAARWPALDGLSWTWLLASYLLITVVRNKASDRYVILLVPPVVVLLVTALLRQGGRWRRLGLAATALAGVANFVGHTWPDLGVRVLKWQPPFGFVAYTPRGTWLRTMTPIPEGNWPIAGIVAHLGAARESFREPRRAALTERALASSASSPDEQVRHAFRALLRRDPDPEALRLAVAAMAEGRRSLSDEVRALAASPEAAMRPLRVLVLPNHLYVNASTLRYQAEWARAPVTLVRMEPGRPAPDIEDFDAVVVKTGAQGPDVSTTTVDLVRRQLERSRFRPLPEVFDCPDDSQVRIHLLAPWGKDGGSPPQGTQVAVRGANDPS